MKSMIFGAICSPSSAIYVLRENAKKHGKKHPEAVKAIEKYHYMDDYLDSFENEAEAIEIVHEVINIHNQGKFRMINWVSNSSHVLKNIPVEILSKSSTDTEKLPTSERTLGLIWYTKDDVLSFPDTFLKKHEKIIVTDNIPTKRELLKVVMSVYDPLGLLAAFTIQARILMQEVWSHKIAWDDKITPDLFRKWKSWLSAVYKIKKLRIPRWYGFSSQIVEIQLHTFTDGSEKGYAAVSYFRMKDSSDQIKTSLVMARSRVTSLKPMTVPRIELQAALLGSRLAKTIENGHSIKIDKKFFWIDSKIVLSWIKSHPRNYKTFVANRIGEISNNTNPDEWHWLPTKFNVADEATRGVWNIDNFQNWFEGPQFLTSEKIKWPHAEEKIEDGTEVEKKKNFVFVINKRCEEIINFSRFSNYLRLVRSVAWVIRFIHLMKKKIGLPTPQIFTELTVEEFEKAELEIIRQSQMSCFFEDIERLNRMKNPRKQSRLRNLNLFIGQDNILRLSGRLDEAQHLDINMRQPIVLDSRNWMTKLLIRHYHKLNHHQGREQIINHLRERFWIINVRSAVKACISSCIICKKKNARVETQQMGLIPDFRTVQQCRPFMITGMDYFGPMTVTIGRRKEKRYGVIFTCMSTRAIHLELASSLTTDSAIMSIRRFICRRGNPSEIHSDNGSNLCGAEKEMKQAIKELDSNRIQQFCCIRHIKWFKNPPAASHMGGIWERMIKSVKSALKVILTQQSPKEEILHTLIVEIEYTVNSHPLTYVSSDHQDVEALTPNHFLIGKSNEVNPLGISADTNSHLRKQWRVAQRYADLFWKRWIREYVPSLIKRSKWQFNSSDVAEGDIVIIADDSFPRNSWPRGKVTRIFPGPDGRVRVVEVTTATGVYRRPITKIILLKPKQ
ncbi:uncharacterized protein [Leptinotarsa decemlineata]|uniref:uncharacterized protein n=1 Tax=Leptinotarsa decemlineata TaxID=7539 RepID=UPI003D3094F2